jgi:Lon protease-like protein
MPRPTRIPLFPLDVVLLPGTDLPLHIFEPRYKLMISRCIEEHLEFGMILAASHSIAAVGCTAEILQTLKQYPDGRMDILTKGRTVFRLKELVDEKEYYEGTVEYVKDDAPALDREQEAQLREVFGKCHAILFGSPWTEPPSEDPANLAYHMASRLPMELDNKQSLLEIRSPHDRREFVLRWMERFLPKLIAQQRAQKLAGGNGHPLN